MFNSFGNLAVDDEAALLFIDFATGAAVQISGTAGLQWDGADSHGDTVELSVAFTVTAVVTGSVARDTDG